MKSLKLFAWTYSLLMMAWFGLSLLDIVAHNLTNPDAISPLNLFGMLIG